MESAAMAEATTGNIILREIETTKVLEAFFQG